MTSFCNTTKPTRSWQRRIADCLGDKTSYQRQAQESDLAPEAPASAPAYWTDDDLSIPTPPSSPWQYHTALAIGATVVCSAGAVMQYAETGLWTQSDNVGPDSDSTANIKQTKDAADTQVSTPPIATPQAQSSVSFSAGTSERSTCRDSTCKGLEFIDRQMPQIQEQVRQLRTEMQLFQSKHTTQNLQTHRTVLSYRSSALASNQAELTVRSQQLEQKFSSVVSILALQPDEISQITNLLQTNADYQGQLQQLRGLQGKIAVEFSNPDLDSTHLQELYTAYYQIEGQLRQTAQVILANHIYAASLESPDPLWQEASYEAPLQQLIDLAHHHQMLVLEQQTINQIAAKLAEQRTELANLLRQYAMMQRQLDGHNHVLQQYVVERQALQADELPS